MCLIYRVECQVSSSTATVRKQSNRKSVFCNSLSTRSILCMTQMLMLLNRNRDKVVSCKPWRTALVCHPRRTLNIARLFLHPAVSSSEVNHELLIRRKPYNLGLRAFGPLVSPKGRQCTRAWCSMISNSGQGSHLNTSHQFSTQYSKILRVTKDTKSREKTHTPCTTSAKNPQNYNRCRTKAKTWEQCSQRAIRT
jgi:hypothetical protein